MGTRNRHGKKFLPLRKHPQEHREEMGRKLHLRLDYIYTRCEEDTFMMRAVGHWKKLPREVVDAPDQKTFKARLDMALGNLIQLKMPLLTGVALDDVPRSLPTQTILLFYETLQTLSSVVGLTTLLELSGSKLK
ncbi:hypothetical protein DUI87_18100 [Hirundo rustica rustica]|uniref:Uncharacterized protein n=1 Tax=Hirundo rustica rustica TaxID=333673 RepID=A0A3M0K0S7_HIRRU|nr:hypothetical protein DUI87_18100 [Hirundo rustica rustica]